MLTKEKNAVPILFGLLVLSFAGCAPESLTDVDIPIPDADTQNSIDRTSTIPVAHASDVVSPASGEFQLPDVSADPETVCCRFLELLNQEDNSKFELLLTPAAMHVSSRLQFHLPPIAERGAKFRALPPKFDSIRKKLCFIDVEFEEESIDGDATLTLMMRKTKSGWRIAGMLVDGQNPETKNLLSFENGDDVLQIKSSVENIDSPVQEH